MPFDPHHPPPAERRLTAEYVSARALAEPAVSVLRAICETLGWDHGGLWDVDANSGILRCRESWHRPALELSEFEATSRRTTFTRGVGLPGRVWASGAPAWLPDVVADSNFPRAPVARHLDSPNA